MENLSKYTIDLKLPQFLNGGLLKNNRDIFILQSNYLKNIENFEPRYLNVVVNTDTVINSQADQLKNAHLGPILSTTDIFT
jgi:hypothetical protein